MWMTREAPSPPSSNANSPDHKPAADRDLVGEAVTEISFDASVPETPESIRFDRSDNAYVCLALTGEIRKITPDGEQSTLARLPIDAPCSNQFPPVATLGLTIDRQDRLYVAVSACDAQNSGLWEVDKDSGEIRQIARSPAGVVWNGIDADGDVVYAAGTFDNRIWRISLDSGEAEVWSDDPKLSPPAGSSGPGPNGILVYQREVYVAISSAGTIVAVEINPDKSAGEARIHGTLPPGQGGDEFAFDVQGRIYCTTDPSNTLVRLDADGTAKILLTAADGVDGSTSVAFGRRGENRKNLYITNAAFPFLTTTFRPSLMRLRVDTPGAS